MISPIAKYILLTIAFVVMSAAIIWIGRHIIADLSDMLDHSDENEKAD
ncbi:MAG: hypothetical protein IJ639_05680 [Ruminococcus sp.]|nr:hypothetical protein [Ruminococcus sp.]